MHGKLAWAALASMLATGCGAPDDTQAPADPVESAETRAGQPIEALDRAASVQQTLDDAEKKRREAIEEQGD